MDSEPEEGELVEDFSRSSAKENPKPETSLVSNPLLRGFPKTSTSRSKPFQSSKVSKASTSQVQSFPKSPNVSILKPSQTDRSGSLIQAPSGSSNPIKHQITSNVGISSSLSEVHLPQKRSKEPSEKFQCKFWENGACNKGDSCTFAHIGSIKVKNELCKYVLTGCCTKGELCGYSHDLSKFPCKYFHGVGVCNAGEDCKFSHVRLANEEIFNFMKTHEQYLKQVFELTGETNLGEYFKLYMSQKAGK